MNELQQLMAKAKKYVEQQKELFGDTRYADRDAATTKAAQKNASRKKQSVAEEKPASGEAIPEEKKSKKEAAKEVVEPVVAGGTALPGEPAGWRDAPTLEVMEQLIQDCRKCRLWETRTKLVFGTGDPHADIMVIGEAPGADEDASGKPFVGRAGQLLTKILAAINLSRDEVFIANIIKSRPPGNRRPLSDEVEACEPYLFKQMEFIKPKFILALGLTSVNTLLRSDYRMGDIRGKQLEYRGATLIATYHPAALLRNPQWKAATWEDVKLLRRLYDEYQQTK